MRLFIAIDLPLELKQALVALRCDLPGARWVAPEQIHLTLAFLGEVEKEVVAGLGSELAGIQLPPFTLALTGLGCFPQRHRPRVLWIGLAPQPCLEQLAVAVQSVLRACGVPVEARPFTAHITLARLKSPAAREVGAFLAQPLPPFPAFSVPEFILFQSRLTASGAEHLPLRRFTLAAG